LRRAPCRYWQSSLVCRSSAVLSGQHRKFGTVLRRLCRRQKLHGASLCIRCLVHWFRVAGNFLVSNVARVEPTLWAYRQSSIDGLPRPHPQSVLHPTLGSNRSWAAMTSTRTLAVSIALLLCGACASTPPMPPPDYLGEAVEACDDQDIPGVTFHLRSSADQLSMDMPRNLLNSAIGSHQFHDIDLCALASSGVCRSIDGQFELQTVSRRNATGRFRLVDDPADAWRTFVLAVRPIGDTVCG